jgi:hypothetical protein
MLSQGTDYAGQKQKQTEDAEGGGGIQRPVEHSGAKCKILKKLHQHGRSADGHKHAAGYYEAVPSYIAVQCHRPGGEQTHQHHGREGEGPEPMAAAALADIQQTAAYRGKADGYEYHGVGVPEPSGQQNDDVEHCRAQYDVARPGHAAVGAQAGDEAAETQCRDDHRCEGQARYALVIGLVGILAGIIFPPGDLVVGIPHRRAAEGAAAHAFLQLYSAFYTVHIMPRFRACNCSLWKPVRPAPPAGRKICAPAPVPRCCGSCLCTSRPRS